MSSRSTFVPYACYIDDITLGITTVVTFTDTNVFSVGEVVSFRVSPQYGTFELNNRQVEVIDRTDDTITVAIDSRN